MENLYCKKLINCLGFHQLNVRFCTTLNIGPIISTYQENPKELAQKIVNLRKQIRNNIKNEIVPDECKDCIYKINEIIGEEDKITEIDLFYWYHCNCGCFYCSYRDVTKSEYSDEVKKGNPVIYETVKELYKLNEISKKEIHIVFGGGEVAVLKEFPKLMDLFLKNNVTEILIDSSGIKYQKTIEKMLKKGKGSITVAVCSGDREVYKKIKNRDKYPQVMKNLANYAKAAKQYKNNSNNIINVISKFIILKGLNNTTEEVEKWLLESVKYGLKHVEISMEFCWGIKTKAGQKIEDYNYELFDYAQKRCDELGLILRKNSTSLALMEQGTY